MITQSDYQQMLDRVTPEVRTKPSREEVSEHKLHDQIADECKRRLWPFVWARMDKRSGVTVGAPDFVIIIDGGKTLWVECKTQDGKLSPEQRIFIAMAKKLGTTVFVVRSMDDFNEAIKEIQKL